MHKTVQRFLIDYVRVKMNTCKATLSVFSSVLADYFETGSVSITRIKNCRR